MCLSAHASIAVGSMVVASRSGGNWRTRILNKLTPEKFDKLGDQLISLGLDSIPVLKGVILLIFEKAIEEPKYSCMYAQLCKKLSRELDFTFDQQQQQQQPTVSGGHRGSGAHEPGAGAVSGPAGSSSSTSGGAASSAAAANTFCRLLLIKCRDEFDNRLKATEKFREKIRLATLASSSNANGSAAAAGGGRSGRRDCNIGQRLHSCFKLDLLKSFRRATPTGAQTGTANIFFIVHLYTVLSLSLFSPPPLFRQRKNAFAL